MNTWWMVTVSEYSTLCLDYGPGASLVSINRDEGEEGEWYGEPRFRDRYDRLRERHRPLVANEASRPLYPPLIPDKSSILHFAACAPWHPSHIDVLHRSHAVNLFIIYVRWSTITTPVDVRTPVEL